LCIIYAQKVMNHIGNIVNLIIQLSNRIGQSAVLGGVKYQPKIVYLCVNYA
jgi:hypothetical protein